MVMGEGTTAQLDMAFQESVELSHGCLADVEQQELPPRLGLEITQDLGMVAVPILQPATLELAPVADALWLQCLEVSLGESALVMLQA